MNASAICGEYLSAGTFLGLAGLVMTFGVDMLWYPVGYTAGYLILLLLVAAPLRRFGAYTIPEFAEDRLDSPGLRRICAVFVLVIGWLYLLPQMKGAGITVAVVTGAPFWVGVVLVAAIVTGSVVFGGMRGITFVQAFQYVVKVIAISVPAVFLLFATTGSERLRLFQETTPVARECTVVRIKTDVRIEISDVLLDVTNRRNLDLASPGNGPCSQADVAPLPAGTRAISAGSVLLIPTGSAIPKIEEGKRVDGEAWRTPFSSGSRPHPLYAGYSLILATFLGTMGLPHILVRFYTNPDGPATRRTIVVVLGLLACYYVWPPIYGALGRLWTPELLLTGQTDAVVILLPGRVFGGLTGSLLTGLVAAGAFAAFLSTSSGLLISVAGAISHDLSRRSTGGVKRFRWAAVIAGLVACVLGLRAERFEINVLVGWAFAIAASSFCPLLILGIWWRRLTAEGAIAGMLIGGGASASAVLYVMLGPPLTGWPGALLGQPAAWTVPIAFAASIIVSLISQPPSRETVNRKMAVLHTPEALRGR